METGHRVVVGDARAIEGLADDTVELVVTSPPYPMIEMWDGLFADLDPAIGDALAAGDGRVAFERMHTILDAVWDEVARVVTDGGLVCINVGDATRTVDGSFRVYPNPARVVRAFTDRGFDPLPEVLWRKPTNAAAKFMGSGMLPPNAYVTLEHEHILVFRNGETPRSFDPGDPRRYEAAYFWEERNRWFSDVWTDVAGERQGLEPAADRRERSAAYPFEIPYRLINMYSVYGDTVLDPFLGTGTTTVAAMVAGRNSVGYERDGDFVAALEDRVRTVPERSREVVADRLAAHRQFVADRRAADKPPAHEAVNYDFPVTARGEREVQLYAVDTVAKTDDGYRVSHVPAADEPPDDVEAPGGTGETH